MSFLHPEFLYYMLPPLFILFGLLLTQKETQAHFFSKEVMDKLRVSANTLTLKARNALFLMIGFFIIIALAQPVIDDGKVMVKAKSADIMIALDISDSMLAEDVYPNRLELAKQKALTLLLKFPDERIGIMAFAKNSYLVSPLSFDTSAVSFLLTQLDTTSITQKGTDFLSILDVFSKSQKSEGEKYLLIFSDGGDSKDFSDEIALAKKSNIVVFILGVGTVKGAPIKLKDGSFIKLHDEILVSTLNENISELATSSGGVYIQNTTSTSDIEAMLREIKSISKEKELKSEEIHKFIPLFYYPVGMALFLLLIATSSMSKRVEVQLPSVFMLFAFMFASVDARAGILDFMDLNEAKEAYKSEDYEKSAKLYEKYAESSKKGEGYFNAANSLYKQKKFKEAVESYEKATFDDKSLRAKNFSNMGNAQAKGQNLQKAVESYEKALKIEEDKDTRENLEEVKKLLKKQKKDSKKSDKQNDKKDKKKDDKSESKDGDKDSDKKDKSKEDEDSSKSKKSKDKEQNKDDMKSKKEKDSDAKDKKSEDAKSEEEKKEQLEKLDKDDEKKSSKEQSKAPNLSKEKMSDAEEAKWIDQLNLQKNTYLYKLGEQKPMKETSNEKPW
ncbi:MAG: VWA domain-containing protein [Sulfurimonas sp.]|nr:VWA domain-containing protein [Sulfurimonas sp.]